jgi:hypothetical protein
MPVPRYLNENEGNIANFNQNFAGWITKYNNTYNNDQYPIIQEIFNEYHVDGNNLLTRVAISNLFNDDQRLDKALIACLMWGLIDSNGRTRFLSSIYGNIQENTNKVCDVKTLITEGNLQDAFQSMQSGGVNNIRGLDYSYFTKILYFIGQNINNLNPKPLIFDRWSSQNYMALLLQLNDQESIDKVRSFYKGLTINFSMNNPGKVHLRGQNVWNVYNAFITDYHNWANEIYTTSSKVEEFTFGYELRGNRNNQNPRLALWEIISNNYTNLLN